ncbi:hypothetical protein AB1Y20_006491 [Prymnesium parvum]|uniref:Uncharacterized protein n=1 Tax=Prymnesium parvum TaxID=97485 RepID=A0AB34J0S6_PRYPA
MFDAPKQPASLVDERIFISLMAPLPDKSPEELFSTARSLMEEREHPPPPPAEPADAEAEGPTVDPVERRASHSNLLARADPSVDLEDPALASAEVGAVKTKANEKVHELISGLESGDFGACQFNDKFKKVWPYAQGHYGLEEEPKPESSRDLLKSVNNHPLAKQHGEFSL